MALTNTHPQYADFLDDWRLTQDVYGGQRIVKEKGVVYLPATEGQLEDGFEVDQPGWKAYQAYKLRAVVHGFFREAVEHNIGVMHAKPPTVELPARLEDMRENATVKNESIELLLRKINEQQLITGRIGLLLDVEDNAPAGTLPYVASYTAPKIINWDDGGREELVKQNLNLVVLDESEFERQADLSWELETKHRVLILGDVEANEPQGGGQYLTGLFRDEGATFIDPTQLVAPSIAGRGLDFIPFAFVNSKDIVPEPDKPPLLSLAELIITLYRTEADYRQQLFMQGQDTLVISGALTEDEDEELRVGSGTRIDLPIGGDAKYIGVESQGLTEMRTAVENDRDEAKQKAGSAINTVGREREAGEALRPRVSAQTATLKQIAKAGAKGVEDVLKWAAIWVGSDPDEVVVEPNLEFQDELMSPAELKEFMEAKNMRAPISRRTIHMNMQRRGMTEMDFEQELEEIESEPPDEEGTGEGGDPPITEPSDE